MWKTNRNCHCPDAGQNTDIVAKSTQITTDFAGFSAAFFNRNVAHSLTLASLTFTLLLSGASSAYAQLGQSLPDSSTINSTQQVTGQYTQGNQSQKDVLDEEAEDDTEADIDTAGEESDTDSETSDAGEAVSFVLEELEVRGVFTLDGSLLEEQISSWVGKRVTYNDLLLIAADITKVYKQNGYVTSRAYIPPQEIENGIAIVEVVEGKIDDIEITGNKYVSNKFIQKRLNQESGDVLHIGMLEEDLVTLKNSSLFKNVHATLKAGNEPGTSDVVLDMQDKFPISVSLGVDNFGRSNIGIYRPSLTVTHNNLTGHGDQLLTNVTLASRTRSIVSQYNYPLNTKGWTLGGMYAYSKVLINQNNKPINDITGRTHRFQLNTNFPIYKSKDESLNVNGNVSAYLVDSMVYLDIDKQYQRPFSLRTNPVSPVDLGGRSIKSIFHVRGIRDQENAAVRGVTSGITAVKQDKLGRTILQSTMTNGLDLFGGNQSFIKFNGDVTRIQDLTHGVIGVFKAQGQWTPNRLPGMEQMQLGGANTIRGYNEGLLTGDKGYMLSAEVRYPIKWGPSWFKNKFQGLAFVDHGRLFITNEDYPRAINGTLAVGNSGYITGYGLGLRGSINKYLSGRFDLGFVTNRDQGKPDLRAHFSLNSTLF